MPAVMLAELKGIGSQIAAVLWSEALYPRQRVTVFLGGRGGDGLHLPRKKNRPIIIDSR
jgi:hypothetical protein